MNSIWPLPLRDLESNQRYYPFLRDEALSVQGALDCKSQKFSSKWLKQFWETTYIFENPTFDSAVISVGIASDCLK